MCLYNFISQLFSFKQSTQDSETGIWETAGSRLLKMGMDGAHYGLEI